MKNIEKKPKLVEKASHVRGLETTYVPHATGLGIQKKPFSRENSANVDLLYNTIRASPEIAACITATIEDLMADSWRFVGSKDAKKKAKAFQLKSKFLKVMTNALFDLIGTGDAYVLKLAVNENQIKSIIKNLTNKLSLKEFGIKFNKQTVYELIKQEVTIPKDLQLLKASTVSINFDQTGKVLGYEQRVGGKVARVYKPEDVIHLSLFNIGGEPYGFTPLETALSDVATLIFAKEFAGNYFENDGIPYFIFHMPNATPDDRNYKNLVTELKELKKKANKYRSMVVTGEVTSEQVNKFNKDMEFSKLIMHFTQVILMTMGVPSHRVNLTMETKQVGGSVNRAYEGYYKKLAFMHQVIESTLNSELWNDFKVEIKFNKVYKIDEMRESQIVQILTQAQLITVEEAREMMGLEPELPKGTMPNATAPNTGKADVDPNQRKLSEDPDKPKNTQDNQTKSIKKSVEETLEVSYLDFLTIVENKTGLGNFDQANVLYMETMDKFILFFSDGSWKYKTKVYKETLDIEKFKFEKLRNAVKLFT